jgi:soluble lytic murein transglycosylase
MEQRLKKTPTLTLGCATACAKFALIVILFIPALSAGKFRSDRPDGAIPKQIVKIVDVRERQPPKEFVRIYSIVRSYRSDIAESEIWRISDVIFEESAKRAIDPLLVLALIHVESRFQSAAVSPMGARGMMQIMPDTGKFLAETLAREDGFHPAAFRPESLDDPVLNVRLGIYYLQDLHKQFQHLNLALAAYNCGPGEVQNRVENNLQMSDEFATLVLDAYQRFKKTKTPVL